MTALNNMGLMLETGYEDVMPNPEEAVRMYKEAYNLGNLDASIHLATYYLSGKFMPADTKKGKAILLKAFSQKSARAAECML